MVHKAEGVVVPRSSAEEWRDIPGRPNYQASSLGRVRMLGHSENFLTRWGTSAVRARHGVILAQQPMTGRHELRLTVSVKNRTTQVSRLVAAAFHGLPTVKKAEVNHLDGNPGNNIPENLEWCTRSANELHAFRTLGKQVWNKGKKFPNPKAVIQRAHGYELRCLDVFLIHNLAGLTQQATAELLGISSRTVCERSQHWKEVMQSE